MANTYTYASDSDFIYIGPLMKNAILSCAEIEGKEGLKVSSMHDI